MDNLVAIRRVFLSSFYLANLIEFILVLFCFFSRLLDGKSDYYYVAKSTIFLVFVITINLIY